MDAVSDRLVARYWLAVADGESVESRAAQLAREQTVEILAGVVPAEIEARAIGVVERIAPLADGRYDVSIGYPLETIGGELLQLLNVLWGNVSLQSGVRLVAVDWPERLLGSFRGPAFGVAGLRRLCRAEGRPLAATVLKPIGLGPRDFARLAADCALGGIDLVKDDHGLADQGWAPWRERVLTVNEQIERANRSTGGATVYAPNLTGPVDRLDERIELLAEIGVRAALVAPLLVGLDCVRALAERSGVVLVAHPAFAGSFALGEQGIAPEVLFGDLFRLAGADAVIFPKPQGRFSFGVDACLAIEERLGAQLGELPPSFLVLGGGVDAARLADWIPRFGVDTIWLVGGSLYAGTDLRAAARELAEIVATTPPRAA